jgi:hypothetical protein
MRAERNDAELVLQFPDVYGKAVYEGMNVLLLEGNKLIGCGKVTHVQ